jgi:hypothetical protein
VQATLRGALQRLLVEGRCAPPVGHMHAHARWHSSYSKPSPQL